MTNINLLPVITAAATTSQDGDCGLLIGFLVSGAALDITGVSFSLGWRSVSPAGVPDPNNIAVLASTAGQYLTSGGTTGVLALNIPKSRMVAIPPGTYLADLVACGNGETVVVGQITFSHATLGPCQITRMTTTVRNAATANSVGYVPGPPPSLEIGTVSTLSAGSQATATVVGSAGAYTLGLGIPAGATGDPGATGASGAAWNQYKGDWSSTTAYTVNDVVFYGVSTWVALAANTDQTPATGSASWNPIALGLDDSALTTATASATASAATATLAAQNAESAAASAVGESIENAVFVSRMPHGVIGAYLMDRPIVRNNCIVIPNLMSPRPISPNLIQIPRRLFSNSGFNFSGTVSDNAAVAVNGLTEATVMTATGNWNFYLSINLPPGTYTMVLVARLHTATPYSIAQTCWSASNPTDIKALSSSYQRLAFTATVAAGAGALVFAQSPDGSTGVSMEVDSVALYAGSEDLEPNGPPLADGHIYLGKYPGDSGPVISGSVVDMSNQGFGLMQWESFEAPDMSVCTVVGLVDKVGPGPNDLVEGEFIVSSMSNFEAFSAFADGPRGWLGFNAGGQAVGQGGANRTLVAGWFSWLTMGFNFIAGKMSASGAGAIFLNNTGLVRDAGPAPTSFPVKDMTFSSLGLNGWSALKHAALVIATRDLTDSEIVNVQGTIAKQLNSYKVATPVVAVPEILIHDGDSISQLGYNTDGSSNLFGGYPMAAAPSLTKVVPVINYAISGAKLADVRTRFASYVLTPSTRQAGQKFYYCVMIGRNDLMGYVSFLNPALTDAAGYANDLQWLYQQASAAGFIPVGITILPATLTGYNAQRDAVNTAIRSWVGSTIVACWDAGDLSTTMGADAAAADTTLYYDGTHPTEVGVANLAASYAAFWNGIL